VCDPLADPAFVDLTKRPIPVTPSLRSALDGGRTFVNPMVTQAGGDEAHPSREGRLFQIKSVIVAPLVARGTPIGILFVTRRKRATDAAFDASNVELVEALAHHAALALANARLIGALDSVERARAHERSIIDTVQAPLVLV